MVLELLRKIQANEDFICFNPSSNGNGAGITENIVAVQNAIMFQSFF